MKILFLKLFRDIGKTVGQFLSILIVLAVGCFFLAGMTEASNAIERQIDDFYKSQNFADSTGYFMYVNSLAVDEIAAREEVTDAEGRNTFYTQTDLDGTRTDVIVTTLTERINTPYIMSGKLPGKNECLVDYVFAKARNMEIGDSMSFSVTPLKTMNLILIEGKDLSLQAENADPVEMTFTVSGIYHSPELIYKVNTHDVAARGDGFCNMLVNYEDIPLFAENANVLIKTPNPVSGDLITFKDYEITTSLSVYTEVVTDLKKDADELFSPYTIENPEQLTEIFSNQDGTAAGLYMYTMDRDSHPSHAAFFATFDQLKKLISVVPLLFFAVAAVITFISLSKTVENQRTQIGVMQAIGIGKGSIYLTYLCYAAFAAIIGALFGGFAGTYSIPFIYSSVFGAQYNMPPFPLSINVFMVAAGLVIAMAVALISAFTSCHRTLREVPARALRPKAPKKTRKIFLERMTGLWKKIGFGGKIILRNIFLHKGRILLSSVGVVGCMTLLIGGLGLKDRVDFILLHHDNSLNFDLQLTMSETVNIGDNGFDISEVLKYDETGNAQYITFTPKINAKVTAANASKDMAIVALPSDDSLERFSLSSDRTMNLYRDYDGKDILSFKKNTFAIPHKLAEDLQIGVGDSVRLTAYTADNQNITADVTVTDIVMQYADQSIYAGYEVFESCGFGLFTNSLLVNVRDADRLGETAASIAKSDHIRSVYTKSDVLGSVIDGISILDAFVAIIIIGAAVLAIAVIYNITAINVFERTREIATLMVLGYRKHETNRLIIIENMVITFIGCLIGVPIGFGLLTWLVSIVNSMNICLPGNLTFPVVLISVGLAFIFSIAATMLLNRKMQKISMVEALKSVE